MIPDSKLPALYTKFSNAVHTAWVGDHSVPRCSCGCGRFADGFCEGRSRYCRDLDWYRERLREIRRREAVRAERIRLALQGIAS